MKKKKNIFENKLQESKKRFWQKNKKKKMRRKNLKNSVRLKQKNI